jgi:hypothetical protein
MPRSVSNQLSVLINRLQASRLEHLAAVADIDRIFTANGIQPRASARRGRPPRAASGNSTPAPRGRRRRTRGRFKVSGKQSILNFVRSAGRSGVPSGEIARQWKSEGRSGEPYITLGELVRDRSLKRQNLRGKRGSQYTMA